MPALLENETVLPQNVSFQTAHSTPPATKSKKNIAHLYLKVKGVLILNVELKRQPQRITLRELHSELSHSIIVQCSILLSYIIFYDVYIFHIVIFYLFQFVVCDSGPLLGSFCF